MTEEGYTRIPLAYSLAIARVGDRVRVATLNCGETNPRLMEMGLLPDAMLKVVSRTAAGSVMVDSREHRLAVGAAMAQCIQVIDAAKP